MVENTSEKRVQSKMNHGRVAKRTKATDCKSVIRGFESHPALLGKYNESK